MSIQWSLVLFSLLAGAGGTLFTMIAVTELRGIAKNARFLAAIVSVVMILAGGICAVTHLAQPTNIMAAAANIFSFSGISIELMLVGITLIVLVVYLVVCKRAGEGACKVVAVIGGICGIALGFATGNGYVFGAQPNWNTVILPIAYLASDLALSAVLMLLLMQVKKDEGDQTSANKTMALVAVVLAVVQIVAFFAYAAVTGFALDALWFWLGAVVIGGIGTLAFATLVWRGSSNAGFPAIAVACAAIGGIAFRCAMWLVGSGILHLFDSAVSFAVL